MSAGDCLISKDIEAFISTLTIMFLLNAKKEPAVKCKSLLLGIIGDKYYWNWVISSNLLTFNSNTIHIN